MFELTTYTTLAGLGVGVVALALFIVLFRIGCVLADVTEPTVAGSVLVVALLFLVTTPLGGVVGYYLLAAESAVAAQSGLVFYPGLAGYVVLIWLLAALVYSFYLAVSYKKGLLVAGVQFLLFALLAVLLTSLTLVVLAVLQITRRPDVARQAASADPPAHVRELGPVSPAWERS